MSRVPFARRFVAAGLLAFAAACSNDSTAPAKILDPAATLADFEAIGDVFTAPQLAGYSAVSSFLSNSGATSSQVMGRVLQLTAPDPGLLRGRTAENERRLEELHGLLPSLSMAGTQGPIIPDAVTGTTYEWNVDSAGYVATARVGAPANGIRFIVYGIDPLTGDPLVPLVETGHVDLLDESTATSGRLHILVQGLGGAPTFLDYTATGTPSATGGTISAAGFVSNGQAGSALRRLDFDVALTLSQTLSAFTANLVAALDVNQPDVSIDISWDYELGQTGRTEAVRFSFQRPGEVIIIEGVYTNSQAGASYDFEVRVNGGIFATITGNAGGVQILDENGDPLTQDEIACLQALFIGWQEVVDLALEILGPALALFGF